MSLHLISIVCLFLSTYFTTIINAQETPFYQNYFVHWGGDHVSVLDQGREVQIKLDPSMGGGIKSIQAYDYGVFQLKIKTPRQSKGFLTTFYLSSLSDGDPERGHGELDFELLGDGIKISTNVFAEDEGHREQQFKHWFDLTANFHEYKITWNHDQIVFFVDEIPIRVYKNYENVGAKYPRDPMYVHATLWNSTQWLGEVDWSKGPFYANFRDFKIQGCSSQTSKVECESPKHIWNWAGYRHLDPKNQKLYEFAKRKSMTYDYCRIPSSSSFPECKMGN